MTGGPLQPLGSAIVKINGFYSLLYVLYDTIPTFPNMLNSRSVPDDQ